MLKTTTGKSHNERVKLPRNRASAEVVLLNRHNYNQFKKNTGCKHVSMATRGAVIKRINQLIMDKIIEGNYNIRIPNLGIITLIKFKVKKISYYAKTKKGEMTSKIHFYSQITGPENRTYILDFDFIAKRDYTRKLKKKFPQLAETIKESF